MENGIYYLTGLNKIQFDEVFGVVENGLSMANSLRGRKSKLSNIDKYY